MHIIKRDYKNILEKPSLSYNCCRPGAGSAPVPWICMHKSSLVPNPAVLVRGKQKVYVFFKGNHYSAPQKHFSGIQMTQTSTVLRVSEPEGSAVWILCSERPPGPKS